jgi:hypothetical protein
MKCSAAAAAAKAAAAPLQQQDEHFFFLLEQLFKNTIKYANIIYPSFRRHHFYFEIIYCLILALT